MNARERQPATAALSWAAAAAAREWLASIRSHEACVALRAAWTSVSEADGAVAQAAEDGGRAIDIQGQIYAGVLEHSAESLRRASVASRRAAKSFKRTSRLDRAAAAELMRACRACRRAADAEHAATMRSRAGKSRTDARDAARRAAAANKRARELLRDAGKLDACAAKSPASGITVGTGAVRQLSLAQYDMLERAKRNRVDSAVLAGKAAEMERVAARIRRLSAAAANLAADEAAGAAAAAAAATTTDGRGADLRAERAAAAWSRAMAAANRADAESPAAGQAA